MPKAHLHQTSISRIDDRFLKHYNLDQIVDNLAGKYLSSPIRSDLTQQRIRFHKTNQARGRSVSYGRSFSATLNYSSTDANVRYQVFLILSFGSSINTFFCKRPSSLNTLSTPMVLLVGKIGYTWENNPALSFVLMKV
ncbi:BnaA02g21490D [Brassica napus]|uniref:BnaA02g21490D protein n=1 Tax=Brassica napus TaxID=3708 RepID=A0A078IE25_BRANA|nr:BnaA02g21490D [Brassica napus]